MTNDWILDVLADLKSFALRNNLTTLAEQLDDTTLVAATEIASREAGPTGAGQGHGATDGTGHRGVSGGRDV